ncbi:MAG TPA: ABC transporter permease [Clostridiales bacterium]|nr:ABC transporter permease [Clostridiales bacterium]
MMNGTKNIVKKELFRVFSDKKMIFSLFILPAVMIIGMYSLMGSLFENMMTDIESHIPRTVIQNAPEGLDEAIATSRFNADITYIDSTADLTSSKDDILNGNTELIIIFEDGFIEKINSYKNAGDPIPEVKTFYNPAEDYSSIARSNFVEQVLGVYQQSILASRIGNMEQLQVFHINRDPNSSVIVNEKKADGKMLSTMLPFLINIMLFAGAMGLGVDAITGEKERGTLSSMLVAPIKRSEIVFGKLISLAILSSISAAVYAFSIVVALPLMMGGIAGDEMGDMKISFTLIEMMQLLVIMLVLVYLYVALVALVAVIAKTSKEANTYVMPVYIMVMLGSLMTFMGSGQTKLEYFLIPIYNSAICIQNLLIGELTALQFGLTVATTALLASIVTALITKAFNNEKIMFNA